MTRKYSIRILLLCLASFLPVGAFAQAKRTPLVINVVVEGLTDDYIELLNPHFGLSGFKRLFKGTTLSHLDFGSQLDPVAATTLLMSGTAPITNGIPSSRTFDPTTGRATQIFYDPAYLGNFTDLTLSPASLKVSTLADEMRIDTDGDGKVYSIAADPQMAIALAGHAANGAYWISDQNANWATSSYYGDMPSVISDRNYRNPLIQRIDTMRWQPVIAMESYPLLSRTERANSFKVTFPKKSAHRIADFKSSPCANTEITDLAIDLMRSVRMGTDYYPDMLCVAYSVAYPGASRAQTLDAIIRLDRDLSRLFAEAEHIAGNGNVTFILSSVPPAHLTVAPDDPRHRIPSGQYSVRKAISLLNMYLIALYGNGDWVSGYFDKQIYLNRKLITDRSLSLTDFRAQVADFLARMAGVADVYTIDDILAGRVGHDPAALKRNTSIPHTGDVIIRVNPGWTIVDDPTDPTSPRGVERHSTTRLPAYILAPGVSTATISSPVDARALAPELSRLLHIRTPNAASTPTLHLR